MVGGWGVLGLAYYKDIKYRKSQYMDTGPIEKQKHLDMSRSLKVKSATQLLIRLLVKPTCLILFPVFSRTTQLLLIIRL